MNRESWRFGNSIIIHTWFDTYGFGRFERFWILHYPSYLPDPPEVSQAPLQTADSYTPQPVP